MKVPQKVANKPTSAIGRLRNPFLEGMTSHGSYMYLSGGEDFIDRIGVGCNANLKIRLRGKGIYG